MTSESIAADTRSSRMRVIREAVQQEARMMIAIDEQSAMKDLVSESISDTKRVHLLGSLGPSSCLSVR